MISISQFVIFSQLRVMSSDISSFTKGAMETIVDLSLSKEKKYWFHFYGNPIMSLKKKNFFAIFQVIEKKNFN